MVRSGSSAGLTKRQAIYEILKRQRRTALTDLAGQTWPMELPIDGEKDHDQLWQERSIDPRGSDALRRPSSSPAVLRRNAWPIPQDPEAAAKPDHLLWRQGDQARLVLLGNPHNPRLKRQYVRDKGPWPYTDDGRPYDVGHIKAVADGGTNTLDNIRPVHPDAHRAEHIANGDFARWARRASIARAFGGTVARGLGPLSLAADILGILTGRVRTNNWDNFASDLIGKQSGEDFWREQEEIRRETAPDAPRGTIFF